MSLYYANQDKMEEERARMQAEAQAGLAQPSGKQERRRRDVDVGKFQLNFMLKEYQTSTSSFSSIREKDRV